MTSRMIPMVHKIDIFNKNPAISKMIPRTIMLRAFLFREPDAVWVGRAVVRLWLQSTTTKRGSTTPLGG